MFSSGANNDPAIHIEGVSIWCPKDQTLLATGQHGRTLTKQDWEHLPSELSCPVCGTVYDVPDITEWE